MFVDIRGKEEVWGWFPPKEVWVMMTPENLSGELLKRKKTFDRNFLQDCRKNRIVEKNNWRMFLQTSEPSIALHLYVSERLQLRILRKTNRWSEKRILHQCAVPRRDFWLHNKTLRADLHPAHRPASLINVTMFRKRIDFLKTFRAVWRQYWKDIRKTNASDVSGHDTYRDHYVCK
jgi:hypothetical protein